MRCLLLIGFSVAFLGLATWPVGWFLCWIRVQSRIAGKRPDNEVGTPPWIVGTFERLLAFFVVLFAFDNAFAILAFWLGAKLAASWQRYPIEPNSPDAGRKVRAGQLCALIAGIVSVLIGVLFGLAVRWSCPMLADGLKQLTNPPMP